LHASSFDGVNRELRPLARMTFPPEFACLTPAMVLKDRPAFRSWILLFGFIPVDFDDIMLVELEPGRAFDERSRLLTMRQWHHRRTLVPTPTGCIVRDEVKCVPRLFVTGPVLFRLYRFAFKLRHRALRRRFGEGPRPSGGL
jgi:hypothetical protein